MASLILATAEGQQAIELRPINSLGRHPNNSIQLLDKIVSKEHCILEQRDGHFILRDLGSLNGTYINGERVRGEQLLKHGDEIALGSTRARYDDGSGAAELRRSPPVGPGRDRSTPAPPAWPPPGAAVAAAVAARSAEALRSMPPAAAPRCAASQASSVPPAAAQPAAANRRCSRYPAHQPPAAAATRRRQRRIARRASAARASTCSTRARAIGTQIAAQTKGFLPFDQVAHDAQQLRVDYERLRITWELTRDIGLERDLDQLLEKILLALFKFTNADRGVILLRDDDGALQPRAARRRDGTRRADPGELDDPEPRHQGARGRAHPRRVDGLRRVEGQDR